jgi:hypothetical protein
MSSPEWQGELERLVSQVPPPQSPVRNDGDWAAFAKQNSFLPPTDYRALVRRYGAGIFGDWLLLIEPFHPTFPFIAAAARECQDLRGVQRQFADFYPAWPIWPDAGGLLPWARTGTGDHIGWRTAGDAEDWTVLLWTRDGDDSREFRLGTVPFLLGLVERSVGDPAFDYDDADPTAADSRPRFRPAPDQAPVPPLLGSALVRFAPLPARHPAFDNAVRAAFHPGAGAECGSIVLRSYGTEGTVPDQLNHQLQIGFDLTCEPTAKQLVLQIGRVIAAPIVEVFDAAHVPSWPDIVGRPGTAT